MNPLLKTPLPRRAGLYKAGEDAGRGQAVLSRVSDCTTSLCVLKGRPALICLDILVLVDTKRG